MLSHLKMFLFKSQLAKSKTKCFCSKGFLSQTLEQGINSITRATNLPNFPIKGSNKAPFSSKLIWTQTPPKVKSLKMAAKMSTLSTRDIFQKYLPGQHLFHFSQLPSMSPRGKFFRKSKYFQTTHEGWCSRGRICWKKLYIIAAGVKIKIFADVLSSSSSFELLRWKRRLNGLGLSPPSFPVKEICKLSNDKRSGRPPSPNS